MGGNLQQSMTQAFYSPEAMRFTSTAARLFGIDGPVAGASYPLTSEQSTLGRHPNSSVHLGAPGVSKTHCTIERDADERYCIVDQGSRNGTEVNGRRIEPETRLELSHGDQITICDCSFFFLNPKSTADAGAMEQIPIDLDAASKEACDVLSSFSDVVELRNARRR